MALYLNPESAMPLFHGRASQNKDERAAELFILRFLRNLEEHVANVRRAG